MSQRVYRIVIQGELNSRFLGAFEGMTASEEKDNTVLTGPVRDQAHLQGLLQRVASLGLTLLSAATVDRGSPG